MHLVPCGGSKLNGSIEKESQPKQQIKDGGKIWEQYPKKKR